MRTGFCDIRPRVRRIGKVIVYEGERGILFRNGVFSRLIEPGKYRIWPFTGVTIHVVDIRRTNLQLTNQKMLTSDNVTVTLNLIASYSVTDPQAAVLTVDSYADQLYADVQLAARNAVAGITLEQVLGDHGGLGEELQRTVAPTAAKYGLTLHSVGVKDVIFSPHVRNLLMKEVEVKRLAHAALNSAREEAAAMRSLLNTARLIEAHPALLRLRELEVARAAVQAGGNTVILGTQSAGPIPVRSPGPTPTPDDEENVESE